MGFFNKLKDGATFRAERFALRDEVRPVTDPLEIYAEAGDLTQLVAAGDWAGLGAFLATLDDEDRAWALHYTLELGGGVHKLIERAAAAAPDDLEAAAMLGASLVVRGWAVRGGGYSSTVGEDAFEVFHDHLRRAEAMFLGVLSREPANLTAGIWRLTSGRGLQVGLNEITRRYEQFAEAHPHHYRAQAQVLQALYPKWYGTWESAHAFALRCAESSPPGSPNAGLVADYHLERWWNHDKAEGLYFTPGVRADIVRAADHSVLHSDYQAPLGWATLHGMFALCLCFSEEWARADRQFDALDNRMAKSPWDLFSDPELMYVDMRFRARHAGRVPAR